MGKIILFDIGKTLLDSRRIIDETLIGTINKLVEQGYIKNKKKFISAYNDVLAKSTHAHVSLTYSELPIIKKVWTSLGNHEDYIFFAFFLFNYRNELRKRIVPDPSILELFERLRKRDILLGIVSDGTSSEQLETLVRLKIISYLEPNLIFISEDIGYEKSDLNFYEYVFKKIQQPPENIYVVGDRIGADIILPKHLGAKTILFGKYVKYSNYENITIKPDYKIEELNEIENII